MLLLPYLIVLPKSISGQHPLLGLEVVLVGLGHLCFHLEICPTPVNRFVMEVALFCIEVILIQTNNLLMAFKLLFHIFVVVVKDMFFYLVFPTTAIGNIRNTDILTNLCHLLGQSWQVPA